MMELRACVKRSISLLLKCCEMAASPHRRVQPTVSPSLEKEPGFCRHCSITRMVCPSHCRGLVYMSSSE